MMPSILEVGGRRSEVGIKQKPSLDEVCPLSRRHTGTRSGQICIPILCIRRYYKCIYGARHYIKEKTAGFVALVRKKRVLLWG